jgi:hypothetical protein
MGSETGTFQMDWLGNHPVRLAPLCSSNIVFGPSIIGLGAAVYLLGRDHADATRRMAAAQTGCQRGPPYSTNDKV